MLPTFWNRPSRQDCTYAALKILQQPGVATGSVKSTPITPPWPKVGITQEHTSLSPQICFHLKCIQIPDLHAYTCQHEAIRIISVCVCVCKHNCGWWRLDGIAVKDEELCAGVCVSGCLGAQREFSMALLDSYCGVQGLMGHIWDLTFNSFHTEQGREGERQTEIKWKIWVTITERKIMSLYTRENANNTDKDEIFNADEWNDHGTKGKVDGRRVLNDGVSGTK